MHRESGRSYKQLQFVYFFIPHPAPNAPKLRTKQIRFMGTHVSPLITHVIVLFTPRRTTTVPAFGQGNKLCFFLKRPINVGWTAGRDARRCQWFSGQMHADPGACPVCRDAAATIRRVAMAHTRGRFAAPLPPHGTAPIQDTPTKQSLGREIAKSSC